MKYLFLFGLSLTLFCTLIAKAAIGNTENVTVQTNIECVIGGSSLGKKTYTVNVPVQIFPNSAGDDFFGVGTYSFDYPHPTNVNIQIFNPQHVTISTPSKYAMKFTTFVKAYTGASWGQGSSLIYFDSFQYFSPLAQSGMIEISQDKKDYCNFSTLIKPL